MKLLARFRKAAALPFVLLLVALNVIVVVALLVYATTELQASHNSGQAEIARALAQSGIDIAAGLIAANSTNNGFVTYQRVISNSPTDFRLETKIGNVTAPDSTKPWKKVVTNPSILHSGFTTNTNPDSFADLNFAVGGDPSSGFIAPRTNVSGWTNLSTNMFRMDWIYIYKGPTNDSKNLVGRVAYWVDDESSKLNINYSGSKDVYGVGNYYTGRSFFLQTVWGSRPPATNTNVFNTLLRCSANWPLNIELGGIAELTMNNASNALAYRNLPLIDGTNFHPFPSTLGIRIGTYKSSNDIAVTNIYQQAALGFTATAYTKEDERTYINGKKRFDILRVHGTVNNTGYQYNDPSGMMSDFKDAITNKYPAFALKYDMDAFAASAVGAFKKPSTTNYDQNNRFYTRGLPLLNEFSILAKAVNTNNTNYVEQQAKIELITLGCVALDSDYAGLTNSNAVIANVIYSPGTSFGCGPYSTSITNVSSWFSTYVENRTYFGPEFNTFSNAIAVLTDNVTNQSPSTNALTWVFPGKVSVVLYYNTLAQSTNMPPPTNYVPYMTNTFVFRVPNNNLGYAPSSTNTNWTTVYHAVAKPQVSNGYAGDPRFVQDFQTDVLPSTTNDLPANSTLATSFGTLNPNWGINNFTNSTNTSPDLVYDQIFYNIDKGISYSPPERLEDGSWNQYFSGPGMIGEIPVTTPTGVTNVLSWSTPRLWGNGRSILNAVEYPPDWLLMDCFHFALYPADTSNPSFIPDKLYVSYGRLNVNTLKSFFQYKPSSSTSKGDSVLDSMLIDVRTKDYRHYAQYTPYDSEWVMINMADTNRSIILSKMIQLSTNRSTSDNPYTTHYEFLADLASSPLSYPKYSGSDVWFGPSNSSGNIYTATNTTDRRIEGLVRGFNQKLTTHGNQFSIFSLGQALQVVNGKTNVVGEAYFQSVYERAPQYNEATGAITNGSANGAPPMRQLYLRELRY